MTVNIVKIAQSGGPGGSGLSQIAVLNASAAQLDATEAQNAVDNVRTMYNAWLALMPNDVTYTVSPVVEAIDELTGTLEGETVAATPPVNVVGTSAAGWAAGVGASIVWNTNQIVNGRRFRGRTYIVPLSGVFDVDGNLQAAAINTLRTAATTMITNMTADGLGVAVWGRPVRVTESNPDATPRPGTVRAVETASVGTRVASLRTRRF